MRLARSFAVLLLLCVASGLHAARVPAAKSEAAKHYVRGEEAWVLGDTDLAIAEWRTALELKPSSTATKDRLIKALSWKAEELTKQLAAKDAELAKRTTRTEIKITGTPEPENQPEPQKPTDQPQKKEEQSSDQPSDPSAIDWSKCLRLGRCWVKTDIYPLSTGRDMYTAPRLSTAVPTLNGEITNLTDQIVVGTKIHIRYTGRMLPAPIDTEVRITLIAPRATVRFNTAMRSGATRYEITGVEAFRLTDQVDFR